MHGGVKTAASILQGIDTPVIVELGCNDGAMGREIVRQIGRRVRYYGVEGDPRALERIVPPERAVIVDAVVGVADGAGEMRLCKDKAGQNRGRGSSTVLEPIPDIFYHPANFHWMDLEEKVPVKVRSLDSLCREWSLDHIDLLWADIEGSEARMLQGATAMLPKVRLMYLEMWIGPLFEGQVPEAELLGPLLENGWTVEYKDPNHALLRNTRYQP